MFYYLQGVHVSVVLRGEEKYLNYASLLYVKNVSPVVEIHVKGVSSHIKREKRWSREFLTLDVEVPYLPNMRWGLNLVREGRGQALHIS